MLLYRGKGASHHLERRREGDHIVIKLPADSNERCLHVVPTYKHLGGIVAVDGNEMADARHRVQLAMNAYAQISAKIFGSKALLQQTRVDFAWSLVFSRLFYNIHLWSNLQSKAVKHLNGLYMRVLRRIADT